MHNNDAPIRVAVIGYGWVTRYFHLPLIASVQGLRVDVIGTQRPGEVAPAQGAQAMQAALQILSPEAAAVSPDVDLVVVASVNASHARLAALALEAGKHVVVEKPFTTTLGEARELAELAQRTGRLLAVFQNRRWDSDFLTVREHIRGNALGELVHFESHIDRYAPNVPDAWREQPTPAGGTWYDLGPHIGDQALTLFGLPELVTANFAQQRAGARTDDWFNVVLDYGRLRVVLHAAQLVPGGAVRFLVHGTEKSLIKYGADQQEKQLLDGKTPRDPLWGVDPDDALIFDPRHAGAPQRIGALRGDQSRFYVETERAIRGLAPNPVAPAEAVAVMALLETAAQSAAERRSLPLPLTAAERAAFDAARRSHT